MPTSHWLYQHVTTWNIQQVPAKITWCLSKTVCAKIASALENSCQILMLKLWISGHISSATATVKPPCATRELIPAPTTVLSTESAEASKSDICWIDVYCIQVLRQQRCFKIFRHHLELLFKSLLFPFTACYDILTTTKIPFSIMSPPCVYFR